MRAKWALTKIHWRGELWLADLNGEDAKVWIHEVESYAFYPSNRTQKSLTIL